MSIEQELFSWGGWDGEPECMVFYQPRLVVDIAEFPMGTVFESATIVQTEEGAIVEFSNGDTPIAKFRLHYRIGERLPSTPPR